MTPLDHELRTALARRAASVGPAPDPLAGIEHRASRIRRRRTLSAVLGAAVAVTAVAVAVPAITGADRADGPPRFATVAPTAVAASYALDPRAPWPMRGTPTADQPSYQRAWRARHPGSTLTPLFAQRYEPSGRDEEAFIATGPDGARYGWISSTPTGPRLVVDEPYDAPMTALQFPLPGDEVARLVVVTTPAAVTVGYAVDGTTFRDVTLIGPAAGQHGASSSSQGASRGAPTQGIAAGRLAGIGVTPLEGRLGSARLRVTVGGGRVVYAEPVRTGTPLSVPTAQPAPVGAPTPAPSPSALGGATPSPAALSAPPTNLLAWPPSGAAPRPADVTALEKAFAVSLGRGSAPAGYRALHSDLTESGVRYTVGQAWLVGSSQAYDVSWTQDRTNPPVFFRGLRTPASPPVLPFLLPVASTFSSDLLVVVAHGGVGQVSYSPDTTTAFRTVASGRSDLNRTALLPRPAGTTGDRLEVLRGDGDLAHPLYRGPVNTLLCAAGSCP